MTTHNGKDMNALSKTPEEIKKGLEYCGKCNGCRGYCPYDSFEDSLEECTSKLAIDALALIQQLEAQVPKWISVEERLPKDRVSVIGFLPIESKNGVPPMREVFHTDRGWYVPAFDEHCIVTHWIPLPEPPKEGSAWSN